MVRNSFRFKVLILYFYPDSILLSRESLLQCSNVFPPFLPRSPIFAANPLTRAQPISHGASLFEPTDGGLEGGCYMFKFASWSVFTHTRNVFFRRRMRVIRHNTSSCIRIYVRKELNGGGCDASKTWSDGRMTKSVSNSIWCVSSHTKIKPTLHRETFSATYARTGSRDAMP